MLGRRTGPIFLIISPRGRRKPALRDQFVASPFFGKDNLVQTSPYRFVRVVQYDYLQSSPSPSMLGEARELSAGNERRRSIMSGHCSGKI
jgi:hypothetical protein